MNEHTETTLPAIGNPMPGGFFTGVIMLNGQRHAIITAPKKLGEFSGVWNPNLNDVAGAKSSVDGRANTIAMADAGCPIARQAMDLKIDGLTDFFIPSQDMAELQYCAFKPNCNDNSQYARSGINISAVPPSYPYTPDFPTQTHLPSFQNGGEEAFESEWYWTSTQHAGYSISAWCQSFDSGYQTTLNTNVQLLLRAVRSQPI